MEMWGKIALGVSALGGILVIGYCLYFDNKRRKDPAFKEKLRQRRKHRRDQESRDFIENHRLPQSMFADPRRHIEFIRMEMETGSYLLSQGRVNEGLGHLVNAVVLSDAPRELLEVIRIHIPNNFYELLVQRLPMMGMGVGYRHFMEQEQGNGNGRGLNVVLDGGDFVGDGHPNPMSHNLRRGGGGSPSPMQVEVIALAEEEDELE